jgi:hypothetical protein
MTRLLVVTLALAGAFVAGSSSAAEAPTARTSLSS